MTSSTATSSLSWTALWRRRGSKRASPHASWRRRTSFGCVYICTLTTSLAVDKVGTSGSRLVCVLELHTFLDQQARDAGQQDSTVSAGTNIGDGSRLGSRLRCR